MPKRNKKTSPTTCWNSPCGWLSKQKQIWVKSLK